MTTTIRQTVKLELDVDGAAVVAALAALPSEHDTWRPEVGDVAYYGTDDFPVLVEAVGVIVHEGGYVERVCQVLYLTDAWGWITGKHGDAPRRVEYRARSTVTTTNASSLSPEPTPLALARWKRDRNVGEYPPYEKVEDWRERKGPREIHNDLVVEG